MKSLICSNCNASRLKISETTLTLKRGSFQLQIKGIPTHICKNCGEEFIPGRIAESLSELAENAYLKVNQAKRELHPVS